MIYRVVTKNVPTARCDNSHPLPVPLPSRERGPRIKTFPPERIRDHSEGEVNRSATHRQEFGMEVRACIGFHYSCQLRK